MRYTKKSPDGAAAEEGPFFKRLIGRLNTWRMSFSVDGEVIAKAAILAFFVVLFSITETTLLSRIRPFGGVPDLLLPFTVAVAMAEREKWGAIFGLVGAFVIDALGGVTVMLLPLLYVPVGIACGLLTTYRFRDSASVAAMFAGAACVLRAGFSFILGMVSVSGITPAETFFDIVLPGFLATVVFAPIPILLVRLTMRPFHKTRAERTMGTK